MKGYVEAAESYFRSKVVRRSLEDLARDYTELDVLAVGNLYLQKGEQNAAFKHDYKSAFEPD